LAVFIIETARSRISFTFSKNARSYLKLVFLNLLDRDELLKFLERLATNSLDIK